VGATAIEALVLVYNADAGRVAAFLDSARKALSLGACTLCDLTHGLFGERSDWAECRLAYRIPVEALHRDELDDPTSGLAGPLPAILARSAGGLVRLVAADELATCTGIDDLDRLIRARAAEHGFAFPEP